jgi:hypothetical protein
VCAATFCWITILGSPASYSDLCLRPLHWLQQLPAALFPLTGLPSTCSFFASGHQFICHLLRDFPLRLHNLNKCPHTPIFSHVTYYHFFSAGLSKAPGSIPSIAMREREKEGKEIILLIVFLLIFSCPPPSQSEYWLCKNNGVLFSLPST